MTPSPKSSLARRVPAPDGPAPRALERHAAWALGGVVCRVVRAEALTEDDGRQARRYWRRYTELLEPRSPEEDDAKVLEFLRLQDEIVFVHAHEGGPMIGLFTFGVRDVPHDGRTVRAVNLSAFLDPELRGTNHTRWEISSYLLRHKLAAPWTELYACFGSHSPKSYVAMARNAAVCWPSAFAPTPAPMNAVMRALERSFYGGAVDPETGLVRVGNRLTASEAALAPDARTRADTQRFLAMNPQYTDGVLLFVVLPVDLANVRSCTARIAQNAWRRAVRRWGRAPEPTDELTPPRRLRARGL